MKSRKPPGLNTLSITDLPPCKGGMSRREFCIIAGAGLVSLGVSACDPGAPRVTVGDGVGDPPPGPGTASGPPVDGGVTTSSPDLAKADGAVAASPDMAHVSAACSPAGFNAGPASGVAVGDAKWLTDNVNYDLFLCRDASGLYALSAQCTHEGYDLVKKTTYFYCPRHGARFDLNGQSPTFPAFSPLEHYAVCVDAAGDVFIDYNKTVAASTRA